MPDIIGDLRFKPAKDIIPILVSELDDKVQKNEQLTVNEIKIFRDVLKKVGVELNE